MRIHLIALFGLIPLIGAAQSVQAPSSDTSPEAELATFQYSDDFEVTLYADEALGIANPIAIHWDSKGRLWVLTTLAYAQLTPGQIPNDTLVVLEDTDGDHRADKSTVFADGLDMPMGFALLPTEDGVYLGEGAHLLKIVDTDGDLKADQREIVFTGFGTGDTHQNISNFIWGPEGNLWFSQGLHCFSRVETPWGIVEGDEAGFWKCEPEELRLTPYCFSNMASQNPCGIIFDDTGALFIKSNNRELIYATPGLVPTTHPLNLLRIANLGATPGKSMGGEFANHASHPDWLRRTILIAGYYSHRVTAFPLIEDGAGYQKVEPVEVLSSTHESFRPVDIRIGPDESIYIVDWYNPIIGHYQASLRHPDRDKKHGRIWRMTPKASKKKPVETFTRNPMRQRLDKVIAAANSDDQNALASALKVLDESRDRHIDHALIQTIHSKSDQIGTINNLEHLAFALETLATPAAAELARERADDPRFQKVLAVVGSAEDRRDILNDPEVTPEMLERLASGTGRAAPPFLPAFQKLILDPERSNSAIRLAGVWQVKPLTDEIGKIALGEGLPLESRSIALQAWARLGGKGIVPSLRAYFKKVGPKEKVAAMSALVTADVTAAAQVLAANVSMLSESDPVPFLQPFLGRNNGMAKLAVAFEKNELSAAEAGHISATLARLGRDDPALTKVLDQAQGITAGDTPYSAELVSEIVGRVETLGDASLGEAVFKRAELACVACHQIDGAGGIIGPSLDTVGAGLPLSILVESILWPNRQLKEGYFAEMITDTEGQIFTGYVEREVDGKIWIRDTALDVERSVLKSQIKSRQNMRSLMPAGLTKSLNDEELAHLVKYLSEKK